MHQTLFLIELKIFIIGCLNACFKAFDWN